MREAGKKCIRCEALAIIRGHYNVKVGSRAQTRLSEERGLADDKLRPWRVLSETREERGESGRLHQKHLLRARKLISFPISERPLI